jgi:vancomycin resistance protein YoaR
VARSTRRDDRPGPESEGGRVVLALVLGLALLAGGAYVAAYLAAGDRVPVGTTVAGVDIGGHDPASATRLLRDQLSSRATTPFTVVVNGRAQQVAPAQVGLDVDYAATVRKAGAARSWRPSRLWRYYTDGTSYEPVVTFDQGRLARLLKRLDDTDGRTPTDGAVVFRHQTFTVRPPRTGLTVDPKAAGTAFWNAYLTQQPSVQLPMSPVAPAIDTAAVDRFVRRFANPAMASAVTLRFGHTPVRLSPSEYGDLLTARRAGNRLRPAVDAAALIRAARAELRGTRSQRPVPATVELVDGQPRVVRAQPGITYARQAVGSALLRAIVADGRTASVRPSLTRPSFTTADARRLGIHRKVATFTVPLPRGAQEREVRTAVRRLDGTVLKPGESLSLRGLLGRATPGGAGGDALATSVFNAAWLGGLRVTDHAPPRTFTGSAPAGRDATLRGGQDVSFTDNSRYGVLVSAVTGRATASHHGTVTVTLWSTPTWQVDSSDSGRTQVVAAGRHVDRNRGCTPRQGHDGFDVTVTRTLTRGAASRHSSYSVSYAPVDAVVCKSPHRRHHHAHHHRHHH